MFDIAVLGGGPGGYVAALRGALRGGRVCLIENKHLGGTCLNVGCIPTKAMLHASEIYHQTKSSSGIGIVANDIQLDQAAFTGQISKVVTNLRKGVGFLLQKRGVEVINGTGIITAANTINVDCEDGNREIQAKNIIIATGARPVKPDFLPWNCERVITTDQATTATSLPKSIVILGGGVIGCEFATAYAELGIAVTVIEMMDTLVPDFDDDIVKAITKSLKKRKVKLLTGARLDEVKVNDDSITAIVGGKEIQADQLLAAIGRMANVEGIGLENIGIQLEGGVIKVDSKCKTNIENVYAIGDVAEKIQYAHLASRMGIVAADNAMGFETCDARDIIPNGIYTHPEIASVGLSEKQALEQFPEAKVASFPYRAAGMAQAYGQIDGMVKLIGKADGAIIGAVIVGPHATDNIQSVTIAMRNGLKIENLAHTIWGHPTFAEGVGEAAEMWLGLPLHTL